jgi:hypothetical protein
VVAGAVLQDDPTGYLTPREWAEEMARIRRIS